MPAVRTRPIDTLTRPSAAITLGERRRSRSTETACPECAFELRTAVTCRRTRRSDRVGDFSFERMRSAARALAFSCSKLVALGMTRTLAFWPAPRQGTRLDRPARRDAPDIVPPKQGLRPDVDITLAPLRRRRLRHGRSHALERLCRGQAFYSRGGAPRIKMRELWFRSSALAWPISLCALQPDA